MPEYIPPQFLDKEKVETLLRMIKAFQENTGVIVTEFTLKSPVLINGYILDTEFTMKVNRE